MLFLVTGRIGSNLRLSEDSDSDLSNQNLPNDLPANTITSQSGIATETPAATPITTTTSKLKQANSTKTDSGSDSGSESDSSDSDSSQSDHEQQQPQKTKKQLQMEQLHKDKAVAAEAVAAAAAAAAAAAVDHDASAAEAVVSELVATPLSSHDPDLKANPEMDPEVISEAGLEPDNDELFSLEHILRNKSTHSPGPQPSPKVSHPHVSYFCRRLSQIPTQSLLNLSFVLKHTAPQGP